MTNVDQKSVLQSSGGQIVTTMRGLVRALMLYDPNNTAIQRLLDTLESVLKTYFSSSDETIQIQLLDEECFINGTLLKVDATLYDNISDLSTRLAPFDVRVVTFESGVGREDLNVFMEDLAKSLRSQERSFPDGGYERIRLANVSGHSVAAYRFAPDQLAIWLFISLMDLVDVLFDEYEAGRSPSLVPLRRCLQLVIGNIKSQRGVYHLLGSLRASPGSAPMRRSRRRSIVGVEAIAFGRYLGCSPQELMTLGLAGILGGLSDSTDSNEAIAPIFDFPGIGLSAIPVILTAHGARSGDARAPDVLSGVLQVIEFFCERAHPLDDKETPAVSNVLRDMSRGKKGLNPALLRLFVWYKGPLPIGSVVQLSDGNAGLVVSFEADTPQEPRVLLLSQDSNSVPVQIGKGGGLAVKGVLPPREGWADPKTLSSIFGSPEGVEEESAQT